MSRRVAILVAAIAASLALPMAASAQPYVGEVRIFAYNFCPAGWHAADGSLLSIAENDTLFNLIGTTYGGDGQETFALPDLRGRLPVGTGTGPGLSTRQLGEAGGVETVTLLASQLPAHNHTENATTLPPTATHPGNRLPALKSRTPIYRTGSASNTVRAAEHVASAGGSQPVDNVPPYTAFTICMSLFGVYPPSN